MSASNGNGNGNGDPPMTPQQVAAAQQIESEYGTDPAQLAAIQQQAAAAQQQSAAARQHAEYEGGAMVIDIRREAEEAQTVRSAEQSYKMQEEAEGNVRQFVEQQQREDRRREEYGVGLQYAQNLASPKRGPYTFGSIVKGAATLVSPIASMPYKTVVISKAAQAYAGGIFAATSYGSRPFHKTAEAQPGPEGWGKSIKKITAHGVGDVIDVVGLFAAFPGAAAVSAKSMALETKRLGRTPHYVEDVIFPEQKRQQRLQDEYGITRDYDRGLGEFEGRSRLVRGTGAAAVAGSAAAMGMSAYRTGKKEGTEWWHDPGYVKAEKIARVAPYVAAYVGSAIFGAFTYRGATGPIARAKGTAKAKRSGHTKGSPQYIATQKKATAEAQAVIDRILQPHEIYAERWVGRRLKGKGWVAGAPAKFPRASKFYEGPMKGTWLPSEIVGEYAIGFGGAVRKAGSQIRKGDLTLSQIKSGELGLTRFRGGSGGGKAFYGAQATKSGSQVTSDQYMSEIMNFESPAQRSKREGAMYETLTTEERQIFLGETPAQRGKYFTAKEAEFGSKISGTKKGTPTESTFSTLTGKHHTATKAEYGSSIQGGRTTRAGTGGGGGGATGTGGGTTTITTTRQDSSEGEESMFSYAEKTNGSKTDKPPGESENGSKTDKPPGETPGESENGRGRSSNLAALIVGAGLLKKKKPKTDRAKGPVDFSFGADWSKELKFEMGDLTIMDLGTAQTNGGSLLGGSLLGGGSSDMLGGNILGTSSKPSQSSYMLGGSALGGSPLGGSLLGSKPRKGKLI